MIDDNLFLRGASALFAKINHIAEKAEKKETEVDSPTLSHRQTIRQQWLEELADDMEQFNMDSTGSEKLDDSIRKGS